MPSTGWPMPTPALLTSRSRRPNFASCAFDGLDDRGLVGEVRGDGDHVAAERLELGARGLELLRTARDDREPVALGDQHAGDGEADAAGGAGDQSGWLHAMHLLGNRRGGAVAPGAEADQHVLFSAVPSAHRTARPAPTSAASVAPVCSLNAMLVSSPEAGRVRSMVPGARKLSLALLALTTSLALSAPAAQAAASKAPKLAEEDQDPGAEGVRAGRRHAHRVQGVRRALPRGEQVGPDHRHRSAREQEAEDEEA